MARASGCSNLICGEAAGLGLPILTPRYSSYLSECVCIYRRISLISDLESFAAIVGYDYQDKTSDAIVHRIVRWKGLGNTDYQKSLRDE